MAEYTPTGHVNVPTPTLPPPLRSLEERRNYLHDQVEGCLAARLACDVPVPLKGETTATAQTRLWRVFLMRHGAALGALGFALRTEMIDSVTYAKLTNAVRDTLLPTQTGELHVPARAVGAANG